MSSDGYNAFLVVNKLYKPQGHLLGVPRPSQISFLHTYIYVEVMEMDRSIDESKETVKDLFDRYRQWIKNNYGRLWNKYRYKIAHDFKPGRSTISYRMPIHQIIYVVASMSFPYRRQRYAVAVSAFSTHKPEMSTKLLIL
jgi:hypothetical protein